MDGSSEILANMVAHGMYLLLGSDVFVIVAVCIFDISRGVCVVRQYEYDFSMLSLGKHGCSCYVSGFL